MFLAILLMSTLLLATIARRDLGGLASARLRSSWLFPAALAIQFVVFNSTALGHALEPWRPAVHVASYAMLVGGLAANVRMPGFKALLAGGLSNFLAIATHGGYMPTNARAIGAVGISGSYEAVQGGVAVSNNSMVLSSRHCTLDVFGDVFVLPSWFPMRNVFSIGDVLIGVGIAIWIWRMTNRNVQQ